MEIMKNEPYIGFVFLPSMKKAVDKLSEEKRNEMVWAIVQYGTSGRYDSKDSFIQCVMETLMPVIDSSQMKYAESIENGSKGGSKPKYDVNEMIKLRAQGLPYCDIASQLGCHENTVALQLRKVIHENNNIDKQKNNNTTTNNNQDTDNDTDNDTDKDTDKENENERNIVKDKYSLKRTGNEKLGTLAFGLSDICRYSDMNDIQCLINKEIRSSMFSLTIDSLLESFNQYEDEVSNTLIYKGRYGRLGVSDALSILAKKIVDGEVSVSTDQQVDQPKKYETKYNASYKDYEDNELPF